MAKETAGLARAGHVVYLVCRNYDRAVRAEQWGLVRVRRLPSVRPRLINRAINFPFFLSPIWLWQIYRLAKTTDAECIVVADLPLAPTAICIGRLLGIPVHYDMAEVYPEFLRSLWQVRRLSLVDHLLRSPRAAALLERRVVRAVHSISVVSTESRERAVAIGANPNDVVVVGNTPDNVDALQREYPFPTALERFARRPRVLFVGVLVPDRGVTEVVEAFGGVLAEIPDASLVIVGDGPDRSRLTRAVERLKLGEHVGLLGWVPHQDLSAFYQHCDVGLLPFLDTPHVRVTLANKLFDYMAAGLAVLAADLPPMRRVLEETHAGVLYEPGNATSFARQLADLLRDDERRKVLGANGRRAVLTKYDWRKDEEVFVRTVERLRRPGRQ